MKLKKSSLANGEAKSAQKVGEKCSKELGIHKRTIKKWKAKFGLNENRRYSEEEKRKIMAKYYQMKRENPRIMVKTVCKKLNISMATLYRWKGEIGEGQQKPEKATALRADGNGQNVWAWNLATGRRQRKTKLRSLY
ncbi:hypothetical protein niasHS_017980 [Heterodera schachtii]|uniref:Transposase n=1 Tax=Heterodera schachtii TaxID=97005 RepID=A0ABD2I1N5_HETSC